MAAFAKKLKILRAVKGINAECVPFLTLSRACTYLCAAVSRLQLHGSAKVTHCLKQGYLCAGCSVPRSVFVGRDYEESVEEESGEEDDPELDSMSVAEEVAPVAQSSRSMPFFSRKKKDASAQGSSQIG